MNKTFTATTKTKYLLNLISKDGFRCVYCRVDLTKIPWVFDHLDNNLSNNGFENIALCCQSCSDKKQDNYDMKLNALEKKRENEKMFVCERENASAQAPSQSQEIESNQQNCEIAEQFLSEKIQIDGSVEYKDALDSITMLCIRKTKHGSQVSVRRYMDALTSSVGPFMFTKNNDGKRIIVNRTGQ